MVTQTTTGCRRASLRPQQQQQKTTPLLLSSAQETQANVHTDSQSWTTEGGKTRPGLMSIDLHLRSAAAGVTVSALRSPHTGFLNDPFDALRAGTGDSHHGCRRKICSSCVLMSH